MRFLQMTLVCGLVLAPVQALAQCMNPDPTGENDCDTDGCRVRQGDCNDSDPTIRGPTCPGRGGAMPIPPGAAPELCDNKDNDCDVMTDEAPVMDAGVACPNSGLSGLCQAGTTTCSSGVMVCRANVMPGTVAETCNNQDDNCNMMTDEGVNQACYTGPAPTRRVGRCTDGAQACTAGTFTGPCVGEILPANPPAQPETSCNNVDDDCDGNRDDGVTQVCYSGPGGTAGVGLCRSGLQTCTNGSFGATCAGEILPANPPAQSETSCNNADDDCDGTPDDGATVRCFTGPSGTFTGTCPGTSCTPRGSCRTGNQACVGGVGSGACTGQVLPVGVPTDPETTCNGADEDCDGNPDDGVAPQACYTGPGGTLGVGLCRGGTQACVGGSFSGPCMGQVTPANPPAQPETSCNNADDDCDGTPDDGATVRCFTGPTGTFTGTCPGPSCMPRGLCAVGSQACVAGAGSGACTGQVLPVGNPTDPEVTCNGQDEDCDGTNDDGVPPRACYTGPGGTLGVGRCRGGTQACTNGNYATTCSGQVTPANTPANNESNSSCNGIDDDCDGTVDDGVTPVCYTGPSGTRGRGICRDGTQACVDGGVSGACMGQVLPESTPSMPEALCDGRDEDCDGNIDDGLGGGTCMTGLPGVCSVGTERCRMTSPGIFQLICEPNVMPGTRAETCNNQDDNCNMQVDEGVPPRSCYDGPTTSFQGTCGLSDGGVQMSGAGAMCLVRAPCIGATQQCNGAGGWLACGASQRLPTPEICDTIDNDCDGNVNNGLIVDLDNDGVRACGSCGALGDGGCDCNDSPDGGAAVRPNRIEQCNGVDDNCDGRLDEASTGTGKIARSCYSGPPGTAGRGVCVQGSQECNSTPGSNTESYGVCMGERTPMMETCNNQDDDCNNTIDDGFDVDRDGFRSCMACGLTMNCDCNDGDMNVRPGAIELCDNVDNDCNNLVDDNITPRACFSDPAGANPPPTTYTGMCPGPTCAPRGVCRTGAQSCSAGMWGSCVGPTLPRAEQCDGRDDDCDGTVDNGTFDVDMDGVVSCALCAARPADAGACDCNDMDATIKPGAPEVCDNVDNDCDGTTDGTNTACYSGPAATRGKGICRDGAQTCMMGMGTGACVGEVLPTLLPDGGMPAFVPDGGVNDPELLCDGRDEDCDGVVDDGFDGDGDGVTQCQNDCDDTDPFNKPGGAEICDCKDNNCNTTIDDGQACLGAPCFDFDSDGFTNCQGDCNDDPNRGGNLVGPNRSEVVGDGHDNDCDGQVDENTDEDGDGFATGGPMNMRDCNDKSADVNPGAVERCDGFDNNCNGTVDEGFDGDRDGVASCAGDCKDDDGSVNPTQIETCGNGKDDNCNGLSDEDVDLDGDGVSTCAGDCNDFNAAVHPAFGSVPAATEICDGQDNDCDYSFDEGFDEDRDRSAVCFGDCDDTDAGVGPHTFEKPNNGADDDCDGEIDEGQVDRDGDGFPPVCGDCNDFDSRINPRAAEACNRIDDNCDAYVDALPGRPNLCSVCFDADGDGQTNCDGDCNDADRTIYRGAPEVCDLKDNDCDQQIDLDPVTGRRVCSGDGGPVVGPTDGGDGGSDADGGLDGGGGTVVEPTDGGSDGPMRDVVTTGCGCGAAQSGLWALALGVVALARRRRRQAASALLVLSVVGLLSGCSSSLTLPGSNVDGGAEVDGGAGELDAGLDAGVDAGLVLPPNWPCPGLSPVAQVSVAVPGSSAPFALPSSLTASEKLIANALLIDGPDLAGFVLQRSVPTSVDPLDPRSVETVASAEIDALIQLGGSPLVRDRLERSSRVLVNDERMNAILRTATTSQQLTFGTATSAFAVRNRLLASLSGIDPRMLGTLPEGVGPTLASEHVVNLFFRITGLQLFVGVVVTPSPKLRENQIVLTDLSNGSHLGDSNGVLTQACRKLVTPALKTDFLFVIDNTISMVEEQAALQDAADGLFLAFQRAGLDFRLGVITTDSEVLRGGGFVTTLGGFKSAAAVGLNGNVTEMGIEFAIKAIARAKAATSPELALRDRATTGLVVIFLSDEDNKSTRVNMMSTYVTDFRAEQGVAFSIVGPKPTGCLKVGRGEASVGTQYIDLANGTGGSSGSICNPNLSEVIEEIVIGALGASSRSPLASRPVSGSLAVRTMRELSRSRVDGFDYEPARNSILFFGASAPTVGSEYEVAFQFFEYNQ